MTLFKFGSRVGSERIGFAGRFFKVEHAFADGVFLVFSGRRGASSRVQEA
jgi:hypothetical protein